MVNNFRVNSEKNRKAQVSIFIIIAVLIVAVVILFFVFRGDIVTQQIPQELEPIYSYYLGCIQESTLGGIGILEQQGGYIEQPEFSLGSEYMPFSSQLDFLGTGVPYWYYISGNGVAKEQKPSKAKMQSQLNDFLEEQVDSCDFSQFNERGFEIDIGKSEVSTVIRDDFVSVSVEQDLVISFENTTWNSKQHSAIVNSNLGKFYDLAEKIYSNNKETMFLENYAVDILRLYAPVDGSEIGCSSKIWSVNEIRDDLINALEVNIPSIKLKGNYYDLSKPENKYFVQDIGDEVDVNVNFMYSKQWPMKMEVWPSEDGILRADPVGLQEGLGILGFCYVPYDFVYDFAYPVLVQLYSDSEIFQFPIVVFINKNNPRESLEGGSLPDVVPELCKNKNTELNVEVYDNNLNSIEAEIKFKCFDTTCNIGKTEPGKGLTADFPQCVNGYIIASAEGFETKKEIISTVSGDSVGIFLNKKYKLDLEIKKDGVSVDEYSVIIFSKGDKVKTVAYPEQKQIELTAGQYEIKSYVYSNTSINLQGSKSSKCVRVPKSGFLGVFGVTEEKCFDMEIPDQIVSFAISGGGTQDYYIGQSELESSDKLVIGVDDFGIPKKVEDLQINYNNVDSRRLGIYFE